MTLDNFTIYNNGEYKCYHNSEDMLEGLWAVYEFNDEIRAGIIIDVDIGSTDEIVLADDVKMDNITKITPTKMSSIIMLYKNKIDCMQYRGITK